MKTFDRKDVYSWANCEEAKKYIGKTGYFADGAFENIDDWQLDVLEEIYSDSDIRSVFQAQKSFYGLFLPEDKIKEVEEPKKWRAFKDFNEFKIWTDKSVGSVIVYRDKLTNDELEAVITRSKLYEDFVEIGAVEYTFKELFDQWEWLNPRNEWQPFGVEVEEQDSKRSKNKEAETSLSDYMDKRIKEIAKE